MKAADYDKLEHDLRAAIAVALAAAARTPDGGCLNNDRLQIKIPGAEYDQVDAIAKKLGLHLTVGKGGYRLGAPIAALDDRNTAQAEAMAASLKAAGWHATVDYFMD